jgi:hypothetical protein
MVIHPRILDHLRFLRTQLCCSVFFLDLEETDPSLMVVGATNWVSEGAASPEWVVVDMFAGREVIVVNRG